MLKVRTIDAVGFAIKADELPFFATGLNAIMGFLIGEASLADFSSSLNDLIDLLQFEIGNKADLVNIDPEILIKHSLIIHYLIKCIIELYLSYL